ncbi:hypothetical protein [Rhodospirillum sp. A1_3_36]|uniref:hypothetical protein n=1 Tax=Rhodospirillum sp. A1_3_36 TaxID=3391666 RepID=UPI0039A4D6B9
MSSKRILRKISQVRFYDNSIKIIFFEMMIFAVFGGFLFESWYAGFGMLFGFFFAFNIKPLNLIMSALFSLFWSIVGAYFGVVFSGGSVNFRGLKWYQVLIEIYSNPISLIIGGLLFYSMFSMHLKVIEWFKDLADEEGKGLADQED